MTGPEPDTKIACRKCGFDLATLPMALPQAHPAKVSGGRDIEVFCPVCGEPHANLMKNRGFFLRETRDDQGRVLSTRWRYWSEAAAQARVGTQGPRPVPIGALSIQFGEEAEPIRATDILFDSVPRFLHPQGGETRAVIPTLPVRPEYLDCLDPDALRKMRAGDEDFKAGEIDRAGKRFYECVLPLRGQSPDQWKRVSVPVGADVEGMFLRHWPNVDDLRWRYHLVSMGFDDVKGRAESARAWEAAALVPRVRRTAAQKLEEDEVVLFRHPLPSPSSKDPSRRVFSVALEGKDSLHQGRPAWVAVSLGGSGGVFALPPGRELETAPMEFGVDFGTSNTVVATQPVGRHEPETVAPRAEATRWLFGRIDPRVDPDELWPGVPWTGQHRDLLPSELLLREGGWTQYNGEPDRASHLKLGVEVGVPLMMAQPLREPSRSTLRPLSLLSDFKWQRALRQQGLEGLAQETWRVQAKFLEAAMTMALVERIRMDGAYPSAVSVWYSFPPAFSDRDKGFLKEAGGGGAQPKPESLAARLRSVLDLPPSAGVTFVEGPDEANAAVFSHDPNREFAVFVDIGGGSMEVVVRDEYVPDGKDGHDGLEHVVSSKSLYFGGGVYLRSLIGAREKGCVMPGIDFPQLGSRVRRYGSGADFIEAPALFAPQRVSTARLRAQVFGDAVADYVARTLAGLCLEHGYQKGTESRPESQRRLNLTRNRLFYWDGKRWKLGSGPDRQRQVKFTLFLLGNGWNTVEIAVPEGSNQDVETFFAGRVRSRLRALLKQEETVARRIRDEVIDLTELNLLIECPRVLDLVKHRKAVVATQVLKEKSGGGTGGKEMRRGVLGLELMMGERRVEWYRPFGPPQQGQNVNAARRSRRSVTAAAPPVYEVGARPEGDGAPPLMPADGPPPLAPTAEVNPWHLASPRREAKGQWDTERLVQELLRHPDAGEWLVWRKGLDGGWSPAKSVPEIAARLAPPVRWAVALGAASLGKGLDLDEARRIVLGSADPHQCKVWRKDFGATWRPVTDVVDFAGVLPARPPPLEEGPPPLGGDEPPPLGSN